MAKQSKKVRVKVGNTIAQLKWLRPELSPWQREELAQTLCKV